MAEPTRVTNDPQSHNPLTSCPPHVKGMGLDGWLPPSIGTLVLLEELYLHDNKVRGLVAAKAFWSLRKILFHPSAPPRNVHAAALPSV